MPLDPLIHRCAEAILLADGLLFTAGAGMGVDSGLPDFRGEAGFLESLSHAASGSPSLDVADPSNAFI